MANSERIITDDLVATIVREADACEPSVYRRMLGLRVKGRPGTRIDRALEARGFAPITANEAPKGAG